MQLPAQDPGAIANAKIDAAYHKMAQDVGRRISKRYGWLVDWFREPMPLENKYGTCMNPLLNSFVSPPQPYEDNPNGALAPPMSVLVFADSYGFASGVLKFAPQERVGRRQIITSPPGQLTTRKLQSVLSEKWDLMLFAVGIDEPKNNTSEEIHKTQKDVCHLLLQISKILVEDKSLVSSICILTADCFADEEEIHKKCGVGLITNSTLFGYGNTVRQELDIPLQYIDTEWSLPETMMPYLSSEVFRKDTFGKNSVRILKSGRWVMRQVDPGPAHTENPCSVDLPQSGVIAISGGNGGVAIIIGHWLVKECARRGIKNVKFMFLSRSMRISDENMPFWQALEEDARRFGIEVEQAKADVSNKESVEAFVAEHADTLGGFVHSAGVLADTLLFKIEWEQFETVWNPKSRAALWMHEACEKYGCPMKLFWLFSSTSVYGNMGQLNYSASNAFLDGLARHRRAIGQAAAVFAWGAWGEVGMATQVNEATKRRMREAPMPYHSNAEGCEGLETVLQTGAPYGQVYKISPEAFVGMVNYLANQKGNSSASFTANFYSGVIPPKPTQDLSSQNAYGAYQALAWEKQTVNPREGLVYKHYVKPRIGEDYDDDD